MTTTMICNEPVCDILRNSTMIDLRRLHVVESDEEIVLTGHVHSYYLKQLAQELVLPALGDRLLRNRIKVVTSHS